MDKKYQTGIQDTVLEIIVQSKKMKLDYITKQQIIAEISKIIPDLKNPDPQVSQALYQLQQKGKYQTTKIKKKYNPLGKRLGWTLADDYRDYEEVQ